MRIVREIGGMMELVRLASAVIEPMFTLLDLKKAEGSWRSWPGGGPKLAAKLAVDELGGGVGVLSEPSALLR